MSTQSVAARIKLARKMAGLATQAQLLERIPDWKPSRLGNYEAGVSTPSADDVRKIARATDASPCWLMFGDGPIRPNERDLQAIRHQNLCHLVDERQERRGGLTRWLKQVGIDRARLDEHIENPFLPIDDAFAAALAAASAQAPAWMDEQHIENDPLCQSFPEDLREVMTLYSGSSAAHRPAILATLRTLVRELGASSRRSGAD